MSLGWSAGGFLGKLRRQISLNLSTGMCRRGRLAEAVCGGAGALFVDAVPDAEHFGCILLNNYRVLIF